MSNVEQIELTIEHAREMVKRRDMAMKLTSNREFKALVLEGYMKDESVRMTHLLADPNMQQHRNAIVESLSAIGQFKQYMSQIVTMGDMAERELADAEEALEEERKAELEG